VIIAKPEWLEPMEGILEVLNEGVGITDDSGHVLFVNQCMERLLGAPRATLIGKAADAFYSGKEYEFTLERRARIKGGGYDRYEFFVPHADGTRVPVIISARELEAPDGSPFLVFTCTDISQQKKAEQNLREANAQLKNRADEIDRELAIASRVQESLAPHPLHWGRVAVETFYKPVRTIGGDFGLVIPSDGTHLDLLVCPLSHYFGWGCQAMYSCYDQLTFTQPFYTSVAYCLGALWASRRLRSPGYLKDAPTDLTEIDEVTGQHSV
jgi:PAS domain S-box-containing protein